MQISIRPIIQIIGTVITVVLALAFGDEIITSSQGVLDNAYITSFIALDTIAQVIPTFYYLGILGIAGAVGFFSVKDIVNNRN